jgi:DNA-binding GntR family transcriptional regulator
VHPRRNLTEWAYFTIKNQILQGILGPGTPLLEETLSARLEISRTPVRGALTRLVAEGLAASREDRTLQVPVLTLQDLEETFVARRTIEGTVMELACAAVNELHLNRLEHLIWNEKMALHAQDGALTAANDRMFHTYLAEMSGNSLFVEFVSRINAKVSLLLALSRTLGAPVALALKEHEEIVTALRSGNPTAAKNAMLRHLHCVEKRIREVLPTDTPEDLPGQRLREEVAPS